MTNKITINPEKIRQLSNDSITDPETIRQIALLGDRELIDKIKRGYEIYGLYPHVMNKFDNDNEDLHKT